MNYYTAIVSFLVFYGVVVSLSAYFKYKLDVKFEKLKHQNTIEQITYAKEATEFKLGDEVIK